jgi:hypothetical protein
MWFRVAFCVLVFSASSLGCDTECAKGPDIQVTVIPGPNVDPARVSGLRVSLSIDGAPPRSVEITLGQQLGVGNSAFLIHPDPAPAGKYNVALTVEALGSGGALVAIAAAGGDVLATGCNALEARLAPLPGQTDDAGVSGDMLPDFGGPPDLAGCAGGGTGPDEDQDNRSDVCDVCAADSDQTATDGENDGVPDACDPDPAKPGNARLYFDPFNSASDDWTGDFEIRNGYINLAIPNGAVISGNPIAKLPVNVRVQGSLYAPFFYGPQLESDEGLFLGNSPSPGSAGSNGMLCVLTIHQQGGNNTLDLATVQNGAITGQTNAPFNFPVTQVRYRMRLTQRGANYTCDVVGGGPTVTVTRNAPSAPVGSQYVSLHAQNIEAHFHSVFAATASATP